MRRVQVPLAVVLLPAFSMGQIPVLERLSKKLTAQEQRVSFLRIMAKCSVEGPGRAGKPAARIAECDLTAVRTTMPLGKMYVSMHPDVLRVDGGGFYAQVAEVCYDGRLGTFLTRKEGMEGQMVSKNAGWIAPDRPKELIALTDFCGWTSTVHGMMDEAGKRFSDGLRQWIRRGRGEHGVTVVAKEIAEGCVLAFSSKNESRELRFDRNGALTYRLDKRGGVIRREVRMSDFSLVNGIFPYPGRVVDVKYDREGLLKSRRVIVVREVSSPDRPEFKIDYPSGTAMDDRVTGRVVKIGRNPREMAEMIRGEVAELREARRAVEPSFKDANSYGWWARLMVGGCVGVGVFVLYLLGRRFRRVAATVACLVCAASVVSAQAARPLADPVFRLLPSERVYNCGVYACAVVQSFLGQEVDPDALAEALEVGGCWSNPTSLARMGAFLKGAGLSVQGFKGGGPSAMEKALEGGEKIAVLHLGRGEGGKGEEGHFLVAVRGSRGGLYVRDVGNRGVWLQATLKRYDRFIAAWTGFALVVSAREGGEVPRPNKSQESVDLLAAASFELDMGEMDRRRRSYAHSVYAVNRSDHDMSIENVSSSCSCVADAYFEKGKAALRAGERRKLYIIVRPSQMKLGTVLKRAVIRVRYGEESREVPIVLKGSVVNRGINRGAFAVPRQLNLGPRHSDEDIEELVNVIVPEGVEMSASADGDIQIESVGVAPYALEFKGKVHSYTVKPTRRSGRVEASVVFTFTGGAVEIMKVPFVVDWRAHQHVSLRHPRSSVADTQR